jgi:3-(methylthio)propionyl---CoA ligase
VGAVASSEGWWRGGQPMSHSMQAYGLTVEKFLDHAAKWHGAAEVVSVSGDGSIVRRGYADIRRRANRLSGALLSLGLKSGDRLATLGWNTLPHLEMWYATMGMGAVCHTLNPRLSLDHLAAMVIQADDRVLAIGAGLGPLAAEILGRCPCIEHLILLDGPESLGPTRVNLLWPFATLLAERGAEVPWGQFDELSEAGLCFTSGTTGAPKGVASTHRSNYLSTLRLLQADAIGLTADDVMLVSVPMFHANAWGLPFAAPAVGAKIVLPGRQVDGASLAHLIAAEGVTAAAGVATVWLGLVEQLEAGSLPSLKRIFLGGTPVSEILISRIESGLGVTVHTSWGMTELSPLGTIWPSTRKSRPSGTSGRPPMGLDLKLTDADGRTLPQQREVEGHLRVKGQSVVERYFGQTESVADEEGYFDTGDIAVIDTEGNLTITGRTKDLIKSGGEWINPAEIERIVSSAPSVSLAAVIARDDPKWGERPVLVVQLRKDATIEDEELLASLRGRLPNWWLPEAVVRIDSMPLTATGKIDKVQLRSEYGGG